MAQLFEKPAYLELTCEQLQEKLNESKVSFKGRISRKVERVRRWIVGDAGTSVKDTASDFPPSYVNEDSLKTPKSAQKLLPLNESITPKVKMEIPKVPYIFDIQNTPTTTTYSAPKGHIDSATTYYDSRNHYHFHNCDHHKHETRYHYVKEPLKEKITQLKENPTVVIKNVQKILNRFIRLDIITTTNTSTTGDTSTTAAYKSSQSVYHHYSHYYNRHYHHPYTLILLLSNYPTLVEDYLIKK